MGNRSALDLMGPTERQILQILWRDGPSTVAHLQAQLGGAPYTTVASPLQSLQKKGFVTKTGTHMALRYQALPKEVLLVLACERMLAELAWSSVAVPIAAAALVLGGLGLLAVDWVVLG